MQPEHRIKQEAAQIGFSAAEITAADIGSQEQERLREFIGNGEHGDMGWMETHMERRTNPRGMEQVICHCSDTELRP